MLNDLVCGLVGTAANDASLGAGLIFFAEVEVSFDTQTPRWNPDGTMV